MTVYTAPLDEMRFVLYEVLGADKLLAELPGHEEHGPELIDAVLEEAGKFCEQQLLPLNRSGDEEGCSLENGVVRTPKGFKEAYDAFARAAGPRSPADPAVWRPGPAESRSTCWSRR